MFMVLASRYMALFAISMRITMVLLEKVFAMARRFPFSSSCVRKSFESSGPLISITESLPYY